LVDAQLLPRGRTQAGDHHLKFYETRDNLRTELGLSWLAFRDAHESAKGLLGEDKDPKEYVEDNG